MHVAASTGRVVAGRYLLQQPIGRGAMGTVWRAQDSLLARDVAVKEVRLRGPVTGAPGAPDGGPVTEETRVLYERTLREARTAARLNHPAVITVFDVIEEADGSPWIVMELIQGRSLEQVVAEDGPLPPHQAADLGARLLGALSSAHAAGILHRDVKPSNVLLGAGGRAVLTDFGIATLEGDTGLTMTGMVMGTPGFTAPERVRGEPASPASDLWSLGATLFAAVEGHGPFDDRRTSLAILAAIAHEEPPRPRLAGPLRPAIEALLRRDPRTRPDAATAGRMLAVAQDGSSPAGPPMDQPDLHLLMPDDEPDGAVAAEPGWSDGQPGWPDAWAPDRAVTATRVEGQPDWAPFGDWPGAGPDDSRVDQDGWPSAGAGQDGWLPAGPDRAVRRRHAAGPQTARFDVAGLAARVRLPTDLRRLLSAVPRWLLAVLAGLLIVLAGLLVGLAVASGGSSTTGTSGSSTGQAAAVRSYTAPGAGFSIRLPAGWSTAQHGHSTVFSNPAGTVTVRVFPVPLAGPAVFAEARLLKAESTAEQQDYPGYRARPSALHPVHFASGSGISWAFSWQPAQGSRRDVVETLLRPAGVAGPNGFLIQESAPAAAFSSAKPVFATALRTFLAQGGTPGPQSAAP